MIKENFEKLTEEDLIFDSLSIPQCWEEFERTGDLKPLENASIALNKVLRESVEILKTTNPENVYLINRLKQFI